MLGSPLYRAVEDVVILGARYDFVQRVGYAIDSEIGQLRQPWESRRALLDTW